MRVAGTGPMVTAMLAMGAPMGTSARAASMLMPCEGCGVLSAAMRAAPGRRIPAEANGWRSREAASHEDMFRAGHAAASGLTARWSARVFPAGDSGFSVETVRRVANRSAAPAAIGAQRDKLSAGSMTLRYATEASPTDRLSMGLIAAMEKRRFALDLVRGHHIKSRSIGLVANWSHGSAWQLESGYRADFGSRAASALERGIELAQGASRSQRGPWTTLSYTIGQPDKASSLSFGVRAQALRIAGGDRLALGASGRTDSRIAFTTSFRFR